jgi:hypothetical protein
MNPLKLTGSVGLLAAALLAGYPLADCGKCASDGKKVAAQLDESRFTLAKAVAAAEEHSKGRAISAIGGLGDKDELMLQVWCIVGSAPDAPRIMKCYVDAKSGTVKGMKEVHEFPVTRDRHAHGEGHEGGDGNMHGGDHPSARVINSQLLEAGCGSCIYAMAGVEGCHLAVVVDGKPYLVQGATWPNHGFCDGKVQAVVTGKLEGDKVVVTSLEPKK